MKYSKDYTKLKLKKYTTIRRYPKGSVGKVVVEYYPSGKHYARITKIERKPFVDIPTDLLLDDTDTFTREEAFELIQSFYKKPIDVFNEKLYIYHMRRLD